MATAVLLPSGRHPRPQSILLQHPAYIPPVPSAARTMVTMGGSRSPNHRRIRFAPLPDPRRSVLITDDGNELPFPQPIFATQFPAPPTPSPTVDPRRDYFASFDSASLSSSSSGSKRNSDPLDPSSSSVSSTPGTATPISITTTSPSETDTNNSVPPSPVACPPSPFSVSSRLSVVSATPAPSASSSKKSTFSFFRSLKRNSTASSSSSSNTLTPVASIDRAQTPTGSIFSRRNFSVSAEEVLTLGTINLFRTPPSRDTDDNDGPSSGWSLARWSSASSSASHYKDKEPSWGHPLARASSTQSYQSKSKSTKSNSRARPITSRKGTRMLNGRVYGVKRPANVNPFANARDDEPEFVEWGYGGMGSVKGATSAGAHGRWERLHGTSTTAKTDVAGESEDDGSGMAWIKKRREQKEREKREQEEKERLEREALEKAESADTETPLPTTTLLSPQHASRPGTASSARTISASSTTTITLSNVSTATLSPPPIPSLSLPLPSPSSLLTPMPSSAHLSTTATPATAVANSAEEEHVTRAVNIPAPAHYHHRHSRAGSKDVYQTMVADLASSSASPRKESAIPSHQRQQIDCPNATSESDSESDAEREDEEDESDEEEDSDEEEKRLEESRKTALGAGVEKISRHH